MTIQPIIQEALQSGVLTADQSRQIQSMLNQNYPTSDDWTALNQLTEALLNGSVTQQNSACFSSQL
jgi:hypothetical protein